MNESFSSNNRENVTRGQLAKKRRYGYCPKFRETICPVIMPNGDAYLCCQDFGLKHKVGNLTCESYDAIKQRILKGQGKFDLCRFCERNQSHFKHMFLVAGSRAGWL